MELPNAATGAPLGGISSRTADAHMSRGLSHAYPMTAVSCHAPSPCTERVIAPGDYGDAAHRYTQKAVDMIGEMATLTTH
jgi:hypothetical protein